MSGFVNLGAVFLSIEVDRERLLNFASFLKPANRNIFYNYSPILLLGTILKLHSTSGDRQKTFWGRGKSRKLSCLWMVLHCKIQYIPRDNLTLGHISSRFGSLFWTIDIWSLFQQFHFLECYFSLSRFDITYNFLWFQNINYALAHYSTKEKEQYFVRIYFASLLPAVHY